MYLATDQLSANRTQADLATCRVATLLEKGSGELNEDALLRENRLFGVFDGATSLTGERFAGGKTGGMLAAQTAAQAFANEQGSLLHRAAEANRLIRDHQFRHAITLEQRHRLWSTSLAVIRLDSGQMEYCQTGDSLILLLLKDGSCRLVTPDLDIDRDTLQMWQASPTASRGSIHELLAEQIHRVRLQMNIDYGVLNGQPEAMDFVHHGRVDLEQVTDVLLFTDGLLLPREDPMARHDWQRFTALYRKGCLTAIREQVRTLQQQDPQCRTYPRFKRHDDIAAIAIGLNS